MRRRTFIAALLSAGVGASAAAAFARYRSPLVTDGEGIPRAAAVVTPTPTPTPPAPSPTPTPTPAPPVSTNPLAAPVPLPGGAISALPDGTGAMAWTVDDGLDGEVVRRYVEFAKATGTRLTFFVTGSYPAWAQNAALLTPLVASGQIQLGNHTWTHPDLTSLSDAGVVDELQRNHDFLTSTFGVDPRPYFRPPYGFHDGRVDRLAASIGYTSPVLWYGSLSDSSLLTDQQVIDFATQWFLPDHIVIGHLNFLPVTEVFPQLTTILVERGLPTVTLHDVFES
ncbi:polysaccharide deacetylase family protein [Cnuibacter sp. UC19_7]|uniref:polysaccharide deacetylase family protein n=1 Tax=Cnuibacter sp. UC19_7 TaxID=3350166 RepID=UPI0036706B50